MKNIRLIPSGKPSRLKQNKITKKLSLVNKGIDLTAYTPINIYITSDEEPKAGDWVITPTNDIIQWAKVFQPIGKKIILTTDTKLISDDVQAIDDEFLEWFVKNPGCKEVKVVKERQHIGEEVDESYPKGFFDYKIIIPKEEPKQETPKEAAERYEKFRVAHDENYIVSGDIQDLKESYYYKGRRDECIKWKVKRMYSYEEVEGIAKDDYSMGRNNILIGVFNKWFNQFKKKISK